METLLSNRLSRPRNNRRRRNQNPTSETILAHTDALHSIRQHPTPHMQRNRKKAPLIIDVEPETFAESLFHLSLSVSY